MGKEWGDEGVRMQHVTGGFQSMHGTLDAGAAVYPVEG